ncbi:hypothetical protein [Arthrobacter sp. A2-55]|uniref:hypothetical protein n=1 Tax=Arthrobacter sp. A2-55 TaxID=2897337 RepID=UPI0021CD722C|nr:hypothetical protein [Arthrobacter sp. A2-55]MCU6480508.1 hypothetical protein [Arthrobacter sp. A2-55]
MTTTTSPSASASGMLDAEFKPANTGHVGFRDYIRRDLAHLHGIDREHLASMDSRPAAEHTRDQKKWTQYASTAEVAALDWIAVNAPGAIPHLRAAGLTVFDPEEH